MQVSRGTARSLPSATWPLGTSSPAGNIEFLTAACIIAIVLAMVVPPSLLNDFISYSRSGGSVLEKFHAYTYVILLSFFLALGTQHADRAQYVYITIFTLILIIYLAIRRRLGFAATVFDIYLSPLLLAYILGKIPNRNLEQIAKCFIAVVTAGALIILLEFTFKFSILKATYSYGFFRPSAFFGHPLTSGIVLCCGMMCAQRFVSKSSTWRFSQFAMMMGIACSGVRGPLAVATVLMFSYIGSSLVRRESSSVLRGTDIGFLMLLPVIFVAAQSAGLFDRIAFAGFIDASAQSRYVIFDSLSLLSREQLMNGIESSVGEAIASFVNESGYIESAFIIAVFAAGLPVAVCLMIIAIILYGRYVTLDFGYALVFALTALGTISLGVKNGAPIALVLTGCLITRLSSRASNGRVERKMAGAS